MMRRFSRFVFIVWPIMWPAVCLAGILIDHHGMAVVGLTCTVIAVLVAIGMAIGEHGSHQRCHRDIDARMGDIARLHGFRMSEAVAGELEDLMDSMECYPSHAFVQIKSLQSALANRIHEIRAAAPEPPLWPLDAEISAPSAAPAEPSDSP